jgi:hypothetical protein
MIVNFVNIIVIFKFILCKSWETLSLLKPLTISTILTV